MKVLYDISWLGLVAQKKMVRSGLSRAIECAAGALLQSPECDVRLCAAHSAEAFSGAYQLLSDTACLPIKRLSSRLGKAIGSRASSLFEKKANEWAPRRGTGFLHRLAEKSISVTRADRNQIAAHDLRTAQIYQAQYLGVPDWIRGAKHLKFVSTVYDLIPIKFSEMFPASEVEYLTGLIDGISARDHVICISESTKRDLCEYRSDLDPNHVSVAYLGASPSFEPCNDLETRQRVRVKYRIPEGPYLLALSSQVAHKNFGRLVESFGALVHEQKIDLNLVISGAAGWALKPLQDALARWSALSKRIIFTGYAAEEDLPGLYGGSLAFVCPSLYEGFGLPVLEAMQCGVAVLCSNASSIPEVAGEAALYFDPRNCDEISATMLKIWRDEPLRSSLTAQALSRAKMFTWKRCAEQTLAAYAQVLNS
jgi:glycosyltransferase involved in cell wall biosynthesis